jgi:hypothetical protein
VLATNNEWCIDSLSKDPEVLSKLIKKIVCNDRVSALCRSVLRVLEIDTKIFNLEELNQLQSFSETWIIDIANLPSSRKNSEGHNFTMGEVLFFSGCSNVVIEFSLVSTLAPRVTELLKVDSDVLDKAIGADEQFIRDVDQLLSSVG